MRNSIHKEGTDSIVHYLQQLLPAAPRMRGFKRQVAEEPPWAAISSTGHLKDTNIYESPVRKQRLPELKVLFS